MSLLFSLIHFCDQFVAPEIRHSWPHCSVCQQTTWYSAFSDEDKILIKCLYLKFYTAKRLTDEFPEKSWTKHPASKVLISSWRSCKTQAQLTGGGTPRSACTEENIETVNDWVLTQDDKLQTHRTVREISWETGIHRSFLIRIIRRDLHLKCIKRWRAQELTDVNCMCCSHEACYACAWEVPADCQWLVSSMQRCCWSLHLTTDRTTVFVVSVEYLQKVWILNFSR